MSKISLKQKSTTMPSPSSTSAASTGETKDTKSPLSSAGRSDSSASSSSSDGNRNYGGQTKEEAHRMGRLIKMKLKLDCAELDLNFASDYDDKENKGWQSILIEKMLNDISFRNKSWSDCNAALHTVWRGLKRAATMTDDERQYKNQSMVDRRVKQALAKAVYMNAHHPLCAMPEAYKREMIVILSDCLVDARSGTRRSLFSPRFMPMILPVWSSSQSTGKENSYKNAESFVLMARSWWSRQFRGMFLELLERWVVPERSWSLQDQVAMAVPLYKCKMNGYTTNDVIPMRIDVYLFRSYISETLFHKLKHLYLTKKGAQRADTIPLLSWKPVEKEPDVMAASAAAAVVASSSSSSSSSRSLASGEAPRMRLAPPNKRKAAAATGVSDTDDVISETDFDEAKKESTKKNKKTSSSRASMGAAKKKSRSERMVSSSDELTNGDDKRVKKKKASKKAESSKAKAKPKQKTTAKETVTKKDGDKGKSTRSTSTTSIKKKASSDADASGNDSDASARSIEYSGDDE